MLVFLLPGGPTVDESNAIDNARQIATAADKEPLSVADRQAALEKLEQALSLLLSKNDRLNAARVLNRIGRLKLYLDEPQIALDSHQRALGLLQGTSAPEVKVDGLNGRAAAYLVLKQFTQAETLLRDALSLSRASHYARGEAEALLTLSDLQNYDNHAVALATADKSLVLWQALDDRRGLARTYLQKGLCFFAQQTLVEAAQNFQQSLKIWQEISDPAEQAEALIMLGYVEYRKGEWQASINYLTQAQGLINEKDQPGKMGQIAAGLAAAFNENGMPDSALIHYQRALEFYTQTKDPHLIMYGGWGIGWTYYVLGNYTEARSRFQQALAGVDPNGLDAALNYEYLGRVDTATGDYPAALQHLQTALVIYQRSINPKDAALVQALMGHVYQQQGQIKRARLYYQQALQAFTRLADRLNQAAVYYALGRLELKLKNYDLAEDCLQRSINVTENMRRVSTGSDLIAAFSATVYERYESYIECLMRKHQAHPLMGLDQRAFQTSEQARGRSLSELLRATQTNLTPGLDPQLAEQEKSLRQSLRVLEDYKVALLSKKYKPEELEKLDADIARLELDYKQVNERIRNQYPAYEQINRPNGWDLRHIQEQVLSDDQTILLEYSLGNESSYVWTVTRRRLGSYELPPGAQITAATKKVYELLKDPPNPDHSSELSRATEELARMILSPVAAELNKRHIIIVADGALNYIPFQILPVPFTNNEPLVTNHEVVNAPSGTILGQLQLEASRRQVPPNVLAAFGDPVFASNYGQFKDDNTGDQIAPAKPNDQTASRNIEPGADSVDPLKIQGLFYTKRELANLRDVAGDQTFVATGFNASRDQLENTNLTKYAILHFATHGILDPEHPEKSGLFLSMVDRNGQAQNGFVGLQDIYRLRAPVNLVVLSACRTGLGKELRGEGLIGLTRGFMYAGASSVVASLWKVDDEATSELMKRFYANMLQSGMTPAAALRTAQNSIRGEPQWNAPYYWAAFVLQGDYGQVVKARPVAAKTGTQRIILLLGLLILLIGAVGIYRRRRRMGPG